MGSPKDEKDRWNNERLHKVIITRPYYIGKYPVTKEQWYMITGERPWKGKKYILDSNKSPAVYISWYDIKDKFLNKLNIMKIGKFEFLNEAEWEWACRSGTTTRYYWGHDLNYKEIDNYAWYYGNADSKSEKYAHEVGLKVKNGFGLYDMSGNVWEWCYDGYTNEDDRNNIKKSSNNNIDLSVVVRGGCWCTKAKWCRSAHRSWEEPNDLWDNVGFRLKLLLSNIYSY